MPALRYAMLMPRCLMPLLQIVHALFAMMPRHAATPACRVRCHALHFFSAYFDDAPPFSSLMPCAFTPFLPPSYADAADAAAMLCRHTRHAAFAVARRHAATYAAALRLLIFRHAFILLRFIIALPLPLLLPCYAYMSAFLCESMITLLPRHAMPAVKMPMFMLFFAMLRHFRRYADTALLLIYAADAYSPLLPLATMPL